MICLPEFSHAPIDLHSHFNHGSLFDCPVPDKAVHNRDLDFVKAAYDHIGIGAAGMSTFASVMEHTECITEENRYLHEQVLAMDWMYQWVVIDPRQEETYHQAERMLSHPKVLGIKIHPTYHDYDILDYADGLFSFAEKHNAVMLMHPQHIPEMPAFCDKYPGMKLIIAHLRTEEFVDAVKNAKHGNLFVDTSGGSGTSNNVIEYAVAQVGSEKILFGTDTNSFAYSYPRIALANISYEDKENILYKNAQRLFPRAFTKEL